MRRRWGLVAMFGASCALPSLAEFSSGAPSTAITPDGAALDADAGGAQPPTDAADAGPDADVRCPPGNAFCDDFEEDPLDRLWGGGRQSGGTLGTGPGTRGRGLVAQVPQHDGEARLEASLEKQLDFSPRQPFTVSFDAKLSVVATGGVLDLDLARFYENRFYNVAIRFGSNGAVYLHEYGDPIGGSSAVGD